MKKTDKDLKKDIELEWEYFRGTQEGERVCKLGFFTTIALHFCEYYVTKKMKEEADDKRK